MMTNIYHKKLLSQPNKAQEELSVQKAVKKKIFLLDVLNNLLKFWEFQLLWNFDGLCKRLLVINISHQLTK